MKNMAEPRWHNPPPFFERRAETLVVRTGNETDYWNRTFYGFTHDNGHFLAHPATGDFTAEVHFSGAYETLYDQAGIMLWVDGQNWLKAGVELTDGAMQFSVVLTRADQSDWSVMPSPIGRAAPMRLRLSRFGDAVRVDAGMPDAGWRMARLGYLAMPAGVEVGPMCCSPLREGLDVTFSHFSIGAPIGRELHD